MNPYLFVINVIPMPENKDCADIASAIAHVWVISEDRESAKNRALDYVTSYLWEVIDLEREFEIQPQQIPVLHEDEALLYKKALQFGIAADYIAHPKIPGKIDNPVIKKRLRRP